MPQVRLALLYHKAAGSLAFVNIKNSELSGPESEITEMIDVLSMWFKSQVMVDALGQGVESGRVDLRQWEHDCRRIIERKPFK